MKTSKPDELIDYLYDEVDGAARQAVELRLEHCEESRSQVAEWRATMARLDEWKIEDKAAPATTLGQRLSPVLKIAAVVAVLVGSGVWIGQHLHRPVEGGALIAAAPEEPEAVEPTVQADEVKKRIIMASGAMTHRQVQAHLQEALKHLESNEIRNETLAVFLPPMEQLAYQEGAKALRTVAQRVARESSRREDFTNQIIARAEKRIAQRH